MQIGDKKFETNSTVPERRYWQVMKRSKKRFNGVKVDGKGYKFNKQDFFETDDPGVAHAIHDSSGQGGTGDVLVIPLEKRADPVHTRTFTVNVSFDKDGRIIRS